jgi:hypothetical protein
MPEMIAHLLQRFTAEWWESEAGAPLLGPKLTEREQSGHEGYLERFLAFLGSEFKRPPRTPSERQSAQERIFEAFAVFARGGLSFEERQIDLLLTSGFTQVGVQFPKMARRFDPAVTGADIFQASRNEWTMNGLQVLLGLPVRLTPAMFAYSMLYPYTDNYLDDPRIPTATKVAFNQRLGCRLSGNNIEPANAFERKIYDLVFTVEEQYDRSQHPQVFDSLLAIHRAQERSVNLLRRGSPPYDVDVLGISLEKGGTSVLADGYLVAGDLTAEQAEFMFGWGAFLQFADDLQDVEGDHKDGLLTVFSQSATRWPLDSITSRTLHFGTRVLQRLDCVDAVGAGPLKELMRRSAALLVTTAAGRARAYHTRPYIQELESHSPFHFSFLAKQSAKMARQRVSLMRLIEAFAVPDDPQ